MPTFFFGTEDLRNKDSMDFFFDFKIEEGDQYMNHQRKKNLLSLFNKRKNVSILFLIYNDLVWSYYFIQILGSFNSNISYRFFDYILTFLNSYENTNSKGDSVFKTQV